MLSGAILERIPSSTIDPGAAIPSKECGDWFVLRTRARQEKLLAADLRAKGIGYFLPLVRTERQYGNRREHVELPLFPGFLFLRGSIDDAYFADRTGRVAQIIVVVDQRCLDLELSYLIRVIRANMKVHPCPSFGRGMGATVCSGPLSGIQGVVEDTAQLHRFVLPVQAVGQAISVEVDAAMVETVA